MRNNPLRLFLTAVMFYTRVPVPAWTGYSQDNLNRATGYFPLVGIGVGAFGGGVYWMARHFWPDPVAVVACMTAMLILTGAFHEDAIADFCDGFGGGYTRERILAIMKDSRVGSFGAIGVAMALLARYALLSQVPPRQFFAVLVAAGALSRFNAVLLIFTADYVRPAADSKSKPIGERHGPLTLALAAAFGLAPLAALPLPAVLRIVPALLAAWLIFRHYVRQRLGGYTGDVLGAFQQISELLFYLFFLAYNFTLPRLG